MIDFRYLLTTIVAVFLALAIGLLIGSGLLADALKEDLERQVESVVDRNSELRDRILDQQSLIEGMETFALQLETGLIGGDLAGEEVVLVRFEGTDGDLIDRLREAIEIADGAIVTTVTVQSAASMTDQVAVDELLADLDVAFADEEEDPAVVVGTEIGARAASDAAGRTQEPSFGSVQDELIDHGFIDVETDAAVPIPTGASFVVVAGAEGEAPYDIATFSEALLSALDRGATAVAAEGWRSGWNFVGNLRGSDVRDRISTIDHGDTVAGSASVVVELRKAAAQEPGHYGFHEGADGIAPESLTGG